MNRWAPSVLRPVEVRIAYRVSVKVFERRRPFGRLNHRREDKIKVNLKIICGNTKWPHLSHDRI